MEKDKRVRRESLLESVIEVSDILRERRPDLETSLLRTLSEVEAILRKNILSDDDLSWLKRDIDLSLSLQVPLRLLPAGAVGGGDGSGALAAVGGDRGSDEKPGGAALRRQQEKEKVRLLS